MPGEVILARPVDDAVLVIEAFDRARLGALRPHAAIVAADAALRRDIGQVFGEMQHGRGVEIGADPEDAAAKPAEAIER